MTEPDELPTERPLLAASLTAVGGAVGYAVPTAAFGRPVTPLSTGAFALGFAVLYLGLAVGRARFDV